MNSASVACDSASVSYESAVEVRPFPCKVHTDHINIDFQMIDGMRVYDCKGCHPDTLTAPARVFAESTYEPCDPCEPCGSEEFKSEDPEAPTVHTEPTNQPVYIGPVKSDLPPCCIHPHIGASKVEVEKSSENPLLDALDKDEKAEADRLIKLEMERLEAEEKKACIDAAVKLQIQINANKAKCHKERTDIRLAWARKQTEFEKIRDKKIDMAKADFELQRQRNDNERDVAFKKAEDSKANADADAKAKARKLFRD